MSRAHDKGYAAEHAVVDLGRRELTPHLERLPAGARLDRGDFTGCPGWVGECKAHDRYDIGGWLRELDQEVENAHAAIGTLIVKPRGVGAPRVGEWWAIRRLADDFRLLRMAGFGTAT